MKNKKILGLAFTLVVFALFSVHATTANAGGGKCSSTVCLSDAYNVAGSETLKVCTDSASPVLGYNLWYNSTGPMNLTNLGIINATYLKNGTAYNSAMGITNSSGCAEFVLNKTLAPFTNETIPIWATAYNNPNFTAASPYNKTILTINYVALHTVDASGNAIPNSVIMLYNDSSKSYLSQGPALSASDGWFVENCVGIINASGCVNPFNSTYNEICVVHGIPFPSQNGTYNGSCQITKSGSAVGYDFLGSNSSQSTTFSPGTASAVVINKHTAVGFANFMTFSGNNPMNQPKQLFASVLNVNDVNGTLVYSMINQQQVNKSKGGVAPFFILPNYEYKISTSIPGMGNYTFSYMAPSTGMTGAEIQVPNSSVYASNGKTVLVGKVVNESGSPMPNAIVYVQIANSGGGSQGISFINSSFTDANGKYSVTVPSTKIVSQRGMQMPYPVYQLYVISADTNGGVNNYFPTIDNNQNRGYFAQGTTAVLPPVTVKAGGIIDVNVTLNGMGLVESELGHFKNLATGLVRNEVASKFTMVSIFSGVTSPTSLIIPLISPASTVSLALFGKNQSIGGPRNGSEPVLGACFTQASTTQGAIGSAQCNLTTPGYLNITVNSYNSIFNQTSPVNDSSSYAGSFQFWFDTKGIIRNQSGNPVMFLSPDGGLLGDLIGQGRNSPSLSIPLPPGTYTLELAPDADFSQHLGVYNTTPFTITQNAATNLTISRSNSWDIQPQFPPSLILAGQNQLRLQVMQMGMPLTNSSINVSIEFLYMNKSAVSNSVTLNYTSGQGGAAFIGKVNPSTMGITAGRYWMLVTATSTIKGVNYTTKRTFPINIFDFQVGLDTGGFTFGTGQIINANLFAYNTSGAQPVGINATAGNITITLYDALGNKVITAATPSAMTDGQATANITLPQQTGFYQLVVKIVSSTGTEGVSENWVRISTLSITSSTDRQAYGTTDNVSLKIQVLNLSSTLPITNATVQAIVDGASTPATGVTNSNGVAILKLNPSVNSQTLGKWAFGYHNIKYTITKETSSDVMKIDSYSGFDVRGLSAQIVFDRPSYQLTDNVTAFTYFPPGTSASGVSAVVDGNSSMQFSGTQSGGGYQINLGKYSVGHHNVKFTITDNSGNTQDIYEGFDVSAYIIKMQTDKFSYSKGEPINITITVSYPNGSVASGVNASVSLLKPQQQNNVLLKSSSGVTSTAGTYSAILNTSSAGFIAVKAIVNGQPAFGGISVSTLTLNLTDSSGTPTSSFTGAPGTNVTINITTNAPDSSTVNARIWAFGSPIDLPPANVTSGKAAIIFTIPSDAPQQTYGMDVQVVSPDGQQGFAVPSSLTVRGGSAASIITGTDRRLYSSSDTAQLFATVTYENGTGVSGKYVSFEVGSKSGAIKSVGTAITDSSGNARISYPLSNLSNGQYFMHAYLTNSTGVQQYNGFNIVGYNVRVTTNKQEYHPGDVINLTLTVTNATSGTSITNAQSANVYVFTPHGQVQYSFTLSGSSPYHVNLTVPSDSSAVGTYPLRAEVTSGQNNGAGGSIVRVVSTQGGLNISVPSQINAGQAFNVSILTSLNGTGSLTIFSPAINNVTYQNNAVSLINATWSNVTINLSQPGVYILRAQQNNVGTFDKAINVIGSGSNAPRVWTGTSLSANTTSFTTSQNVYLESNTANATARVFMNDALGDTISYSVKLNQMNSRTYYGVLSSSLTITGDAFVRLDTNKASGVANSLIKIS